MARRRPPPVPPPPAPRPPGTDLWDPTAHAGQGAWRPSVYLATSATPPPPSPHAADHAALVAASTDPSAAPTLRAATERLRRLERVVARLLARPEGGA